MADRGSSKGTLYVMTRSARLPTIKIHAGTGKTGSSYLQELFRENTSATGNLYLQYPPRDSFVDQVAAAWERARLQEVDLIVSSESIAGWLGDGQLFDELETYLRSQQIVADLLIFCRNPPEHVLSDWSQRQKGDGKGSELSLTEVGSRFRINDRILVTSRRARDSREFRLTIFNYTNVKDRLRKIAAEFLGISEEQLIASLPDFAKKNRIVNRSLTLHEIMFVRALRRFGFPLFGNGQESFGWYLCLQHRPVGRGRPLLSEQQMGLLLDSVLPAVQSLNAEFDLALEVDQPEFVRAVRRPFDFSRIRSNSILLVWYVQWLMTSQSIPGRALFGRGHT